METNVKIAEARMMNRSASASLYVSAMTRWAVLFLPPPTAVVSFFAATK
jgi:hypothetical protein